MPANSRDTGKDYNAFGCDPEGRVASIAGLMFGPNWVPDANLAVPQPPNHVQPAAPRYGPPTPYQVPFLGANFVPHIPPGYYHPYPGGMYPPHPSNMPPAPQPLPAGHPLAHGLLYAPYHIQTPTPPIQPQHRPAPAADSGLSAPAKEKPNPIWLRIVFTFITEVVAGAIKREFSAQTDMTWDDFRSRVCAYLDTSPKIAQLAGKIIGERGKHTLLIHSPDFVAIMEHLAKKASTARKVPVGFEVKDNAAPQVSHRSKKRSREEDIPP